MMNKVLITLIFLSSLVFSEVHAQFNADNNSLEVMSWNIEWFGNPNRGPKNDSLQGLRVMQIIKSLKHPDVICLQEICDNDLLSSIADSCNYSIYLAPGGMNNLKMGFLYSKELTLIENPKEILQEHRSAFAGRPPIMVKFRHTELGEVTIINIHLKAHIPRSSDEKKLDSYERRKLSAVLLLSYVRDNLAGGNVIVLGDWNDDIDKSNYSDLESPFKSILDSKDMRFVSKYLSYTLNKSSKYGSVIDHICITDELFDNFRSCSFVGTESIMKQYLKECSDHYPVYAVFE